MKKILLSLSLLLLIFVIPFRPYAQDDSTAQYDWYRPGTINPLDPKIGDFLDIDLDNLLIQADGFYQGRDYIDAARLYLVYLHYNIDDPVAIYNLACCYGLMDEPELAAGYLQRAVRDGFRNLQLLKNDTDFDKVRDNRKFKKVHDSLTALISEVNEDAGTAEYLDLEYPVRYRVTMPKWFNPGKSYPLILGLHGAGGNPSEFMRTLKTSGIEDMIFVTIPGPYASGGDYQPGYLWYDRDTEDSAVIRKSYDMTADYIAEVVRQLRKKYKIDKTVLVGFSMGARMAYGAAIKNYDLINGLIAFGGDLPEELISESELKNAQRLKVYMVHGTGDLSVPYAAAQRTKSFLSDRGYKVSFYTFDGGHFVPANLLTETLKYALE